MVADSSAAAAPASELGSAPSLPQDRGVAIIGVQPYVTNFNIAIRGASLDACKAIEASIRTTFGVQVMALPHADDLVEIGCNLQAGDERDSPSREAVLALIAGELPSEASIARSYVIGLTPAEAHAKGEDMLSQQQQQLPAVEA